jgi:hypothetical protein
MCCQVCYCCMYSRVVAAEPDNNLIGAIHVATNLRSQHKLQPHWPTSSTCRQICHLIGSTATQCKEPEHVVHYFSKNSQPPRSFRDKLAVVLPDWRRAAPCQLLLTEACLDDESMLRNVTPLLTSADCSQRWTLQEGILQQKYNIFNTLRSSGMHPC